VLLYSGVRYWEEIVIRKLCVLTLFLVMTVGATAKPLQWKVGASIFKISVDYRLMYLGVSEITLLNPKLQAYNLPWEHEAMHRATLGFTLTRFFGKKTSPLSLFRVFLNLDLLNGPLNSPPSARHVLVLSRDPRDSNYGLSFSSWGLNEAYIMVAGMRAAIVMGRMQPDFGMGILTSKRKDPFFGYSGTGDRTDRAAVKLFMGDWVKLHSPRQFFIGGGVDKVSRDLLANTNVDDIAYQAFGVIGLSNQHMGGEAAYIYRWQHNADGDYIRLNILDFTMHGHVKWKGGEFKAKGEYVWVRGHNDIGRMTANSGGYKVDTQGLAAQVEVRQNMFGFRVETGLAQGDSNPYDNTFGAFTFNTEHKVGLVAFSEMIKDLTAASAYNMTDPTFLAQAPSGYKGLPSNGGVSNAIYLYPGVSLKPWSFLEFRTAVLFAWADKPMYDLYATDLSGGQLKSPLGGTAGKYIGTEYDLGLFSNFELAKGGPRLRVFAQFGIFFPGSAFNMAYNSLPDSVKLVNTGLNFSW